MSLRHLKTVFPFSDGFKKNSQACLITTGLGKGRQKKV